MQLRKKHTRTKHKGPRSSQMRSGFTHAERYVKRFTVLNKTVFNTINKLVTTKNVSLHIQLLEDLGPRPLDPFIHEAN